MESERLPTDRSSEPNQWHLIHQPNGDGPVVLDPTEPDALDWAAEAVIDGGVIALPTDTVYGIGASLAHRAALQRIFAIKQRPADRILPILLSSPASLERIALELDERLELLLARYWPGPLTTVVPARQGMPPEVLAPDQTVGARVPNHPVALALIERVGGTMAVTSANRSGQPEAKTSNEVIRQLAGTGLDLVLDGGRTPGGVASTVIAVRDGELAILREGAIPSEHLRAAWAEFTGGR